jgi:transcriptional regulator with XRE-family HTH domain
MTRPPKDPDLATFAGRAGALIRQRRSKARLSVEEAAERAGVPPTTWYRWEKGENLPRMERLPAIATALKCTTTQLVPKE